MPYKKMFRMLRKTKGIAGLLESVEEASVLMNSRQMKRIHTIPFQSVCDRGEGTRMEI
jgi:hypothetical protein